jgi:p24 family protein alpha
MWSILPLLTLSAVLAPVQALHFYIDGTAPKCFFEELPKDTIVVGRYTAEEYDEQRKVWSKHDGLNIYISVDVRIPPQQHALNPLNPLFNSLFVSQSVSPLR